MIMGQFTVESFTKSDYFLHEPDYLYFFRFKLETNKNDLGNINLLNNVNINDLKNKFELELKKLTDNKVPNSRIKLDYYSFLIELEYKNEELEFLLKHPVDDKYIQKSRQIFKIPETEEPFEIATIDKSSISSFIKEILYVFEELIEMYLSDKKNIKKFINQYNLNKQVDKMIPLKGYDLNLYILGKTVKLPHLVYNIDVRKKDNNIIFKLEVIDMVTFLYKTFLKCLSE
jgi:hypothetical protein